MASHYLVTGKFPPVQGGTSNQLFWMVRSWLERGTDCTVIDIPDAYEPWEVMDVSLAEVRDYLLATARGTLDLRAAASDLAHAHSIPNHEPLVSRLAAALLRSVQDNRPDALIASYLEPYGVAAAIVARREYLPLVVIHAGSDLARLARSPQREAIYRSVLQEADVVVSSRSSSRLALDRGAREETLWPDRPTFVPKQLYAGATGAPVQTETTPRRIGILGKLGETKGSRDILLAMREAIDLGHDLRLEIVTGSGSPGCDWFLREAQRLKVSGRVSVRHFVAPWEVPDFYASCSAMAFLERGFPVATHRPQVPREVIASGVPLVVSSEIAQAASISPSTPGVFIVDPLNTRDLVSALIQASNRQRIMAEGVAPQVRWTEPSDVEAWNRDLEEEVSIVKNELTSKTHAVERFHETVLRLYADPPFRLQLEKNGTGLENLASEHRAAVEQLLADPHLETYCDSLRRKKYRYLRRKFRPALEPFPPVEGVLEEQFMSTWKLQSDGPAEFERFRAMVVEAGVKALGSNLQELKRLQILSQLIAAEQECWSDWSTAGVTYLQPGELLANPTIRFLEFDQKLMGEKLVPTTWRVVVWKDSADKVRRMEVSESVMALLQRLCVPTTMDRSVGDLSRASGQSASAAAGAIASLLEKDLLAEAE